MSSFNGHPADTEGWGGSQGRRLRLAAASCGPSNGTAEREIGVNELEFRDPILQPSSHFYLSSATLPTFHQN